VVIERLLVERVLHDSTRPSLADAEDRGRRESVRLDTAAIVESSFTCCRPTRRFRITSLKSGSNPQTR
jgi:hypothetical protein